MAFKEKYFEGFAVLITGERLGGKIVVTPHAWNVHPSQPDVVIDRTWHEGQGLLYVGVEFSVERADDATWNGDGSVLLDDKRGYPLFRQRWTGEPDGIIWPFSERLEMIRNNDREAAKKWLKRNREELGL